MEQFINVEAITLGAAITSTGATSITLSSVTGLPSSGTCRIKIDSEYMIVTLNGTTTVTVTRGAEGSTAATHSSGVAVSFVLTSGALNQFRSDNMMYGTTSSRPAAGAAGRIYHCTDSPYTCYDNGTSWDLYVGPKKCTPPVMADLTQVGNTSTEYSAYGDATLVYFNSNNITSHSYASIFVEALTSGHNWSLEFGMLPNHGFGIQVFLSPVFWESSTGKTCFAGYQYNTGGSSISFSNLNLNVSGTSASYIGNDGDQAFPFEAMRYLKYTYNTSDSYITVWSSPDGINWMNCENLSFSTYFTTGPDNIGFGIDPITVAFNAGMIVFHYNLEYTS